MGIDWTLLRFDCFFYACCVLLIQSFFLHSLKASNHIIIINSRWKQKELIRVRWNRMINYPIKRHGSFVFFMKRCAGEIWRNDHPCSKCTDVISIYNEATGKPHCSKSASFGSCIQLDWVLVPYLWCIIRKCRRSNQKLHCSNVVSRFTPKLCCILKTPPNTPAPRL